MIPSGDGSLAVILGRIHEKEGEEAGPGEGDTAIPRNSLFRQRRPRVHRPRCLRGWRNRGLYFGFPISLSEDAREYRLLTCVPPGLAGGRSLYHQH